MFGNFLAFVALKFLGLGVIVLVLIISTVFASITSVFWFVRRAFLVIVLDAMSTLLVEEASPSFHKVLMFFRTKSVYNSVNIYSHRVTISLGLELIRITVLVLGVLRGSRGVVSSHHLSLMPVVIKSDCLCHPSSKRL